LDAAKKKMRGSQFHVKEQKNDSNKLEELHVTDPWGNQFRLVQGDPSERDVRGQQPGESVSEGLALRDLTLYAPAGSNVAGIARFYEQVFGAPVQEQNNQRCVIAVGPQQTLTFEEHPDEKTVVQHEDLRDEQKESPAGFPTFLSNYGPHVSIYVADLSAT
jgi:hypothetical protein